jgi:WD40 repeat protein
VIHHFSSSNIKTTSTSLSDPLTPFPIRSLSFFPSSVSSSSDMLLSGGDDGQIYIWDGVSGIFYYIPLINSI